MTRKKYCFIVILAAILLQQGCKTLPPSEATVLRPVLATFELEGRIAVYNNKQSLHARFEWQHLLQHDKWTMFSPLGQIVAAVERTPEQIQLVTAEGETHHAENVSILSERLLGIPLSFEQLVYWVQGALFPGIEAYRFDSVGRPAVVIDQGWRIEYLEYETDAADALPSRVEISRGEDRIRLIIDHWEVPF